MFGRFSAKLGPKTRLERRGSSCSAGCTKISLADPCKDHFEAVQNSERTPSNEPLSLNVSDSSSAASLTSQGRPLCSGVFSPPDPPSCRHITYSIHNFCRGSVICGICGGGAIASHELWRWRRRLHTSRRCFHTSCDEKLFRSRVSIKFIWDFFGPGARGPGRGPGVLRSFRTKKQGPGCMLTREPLKFGAADVTKPYYQLNYVV